MKWTLILPLLLVVAGCYKRKTLPREPFVLRGRIAQCGTAKLLPGCRVEINTGTYSSGRFYRSREVGLATSDDSGRFAITPLEYLENEMFELRLSGPGYLQKDIYTLREDIVLHGSIFDYGELCLQER